MSIKKKLLTLSIDLFHIIDNLPEMDIHKLPITYKKRLHSRINKSLADLHAFLKLIRHSMPTDSRFLFLDVDEDGNKYLFKPYKVNEFAYKEYPVVCLNKKLIGAFKECVEILSDKGYEVEIINGIIPFARWGAFSYKYRLLETHSRGKAVDFLIKDKNPKESLEIIKQVFSNIPRPFLFIELPTHIHFQFNIIKECYFIPLNRHTYYSCNKQFPSLFFNPNHYLSKVSRGLS